MNLICVFIIIIIIIIPFTLAKLKSIEIPEEHSVVSEWFVPIQSLMWFCLSHNTSIKGSRCSLGFVTKLSFFYSLSLSFSVSLQLLLRWKSFPLRASSVRETPSVSPALLPATHCECTRSFRLCVFLSKCICQFVCGRFWWMWKRVWSSVSTCALKLIIWTGPTGTAFIF